MLRWLQSLFSNIFRFNLPCNKIRIYEFPQLVIKLIDEIRFQKFSTENFPMLICVHHLGFVRKHCNKETWPFWRKRSFKQLSEIPDFAPAPSPSIQFGPFFLIVSPLLDRCLCLCFFYFGHFVFFDLWLLFTPFVIVKLF